MCLVACSGDDDDDEKGTNTTDTGNEGEGTEDTSEDTDTGTGTEEEIACDYPEVSEFSDWGTGAAWGVDVTVSNWSLTGYFDQDCDGTIDEVETDFTLDDVRRTGAHTAIVVIGGLF